MTVPAGEQTGELGDRSGMEPCMGVATSFPASISDDSRPLWPYRPWRCTTLCCVPPLCCSSVALATGETLLHGLLVPVLVRLQTLPDRLRLVARLRALRQMGSCRSTSSNGSLQWRCSIAETCSIAPVPGLLLLI